MTAEEARKAATAVNDFRFAPIISSCNTAIKQAVNRGEFVCKIEVKSELMGRVTSHYKQLGYNVHPVPMNNILEISWR